MTRPADHRTAALAAALVLVSTTCVACTPPAATSPNRAAPSWTSQTTPPSTPAPSTTIASSTGGPSPTVVPSPASIPTPNPEPVPAFEATVSALPPDVINRMTGVSWRDGCPVPLSDLRYLTLTHRTFEGGTAQGELVAHTEVADSLVEVFRDLFDAHYPIRSLRLVDDFGGSDDASMAADNTSAFNCRPVAGSTRWSEHAYGRAIDVNPVENPWVRGDTVEPPAGRPYVRRPAEPGVILPDDAVVRAFQAAGWLWGGSWESPKDYQHFSTTGR